MKGQLVFEFVIATLFFLGIVMYTINVLNNTVGTYSGDHRDSILESRAWQVSEALTRSPGAWRMSGLGLVPDSLGLADEWPVMDEAKIAGLSKMCTTDMDRVVSLLDADPRYNDIAVRIHKFSGSGESTMLDCGNIPAEVPYSMITRFGVSDLDGMLLKTEVWYY